MQKQLVNLRNEIEWFKNNKDYTYLDSGATSLKPKSVVDSIVNYCNYISTNPHNDDSMFAHQALKVLKETRKKIAKLLNTDSSNIIFTPGATYSLNFVASFLEPFLNEGDEIILTNAEHASNLLPWYDLREKKKLNIVFIDVDLKSDNIDKFLSKISSKTKLVSFANETNLLGNSIDALELSKKIKQINPNIFVNVDACQFLAHNTINLENSNIDFLSCSAHKMLGPTGVGALFINSNLINKVKPKIVGGGMNFEIKKNYYTLVSGAEKFEAGTPNIMGIYGWCEALDYYFDPEMEKEKKRIYSIKKYLDEEINKIEGFKVLNYGIDSFNTIFVKEGLFSQDLASYLGTNKIIVRSGLSCAKLANEVLNENHVVRASFHFYTNLEDVNNLIDVLKKYKKGDELNVLF